MQNESRVTEARARRTRVRRLSLLIAVVLTAGLAAGVGSNFIFAKPRARIEPAKSAPKKPAAREKTVEEKEREAEERVDKGAGEAQFLVAQAMAHTSALSEQIGERPAGSVRESGAADYIVSRLGEFGYTVEEQSFTMTDGFSSRNIVGTRKGVKGGYVIVVGAHYDGPGGSAGANDNASGAGAVLELARVFSVRRLEPSLQFVFFGGNRPGRSDPTVRLVGSRHYVDLLGSMERRDLVSMINLDGLGVGSVLSVKTAGTGLQRLKDKLSTFARMEKIGVTYIKSDTDSDNIPFENSRVPAVWLGWCEPDGSIAADNTYAGVSAQKVETAGVLVESFILGLTSGDLEELKY